MAGDARHRHRRDDAVLLLLPRARADPRPVRGVLRRAADAQLHAHRRHALRPHRRLDRALPRVHRRRSRRKVDEYEALLTDNRIWKTRTVGVGVLSPEDGDRLGHHGPDAARHRASSGTCAGRGPTRPTPSVEFDVPVRHERRHLRPLPGAHGGDAAVGPHHPAVPREAARKVR